MKIQRKALIRNLVIAMIVADGAGVYYVSQRLSQPVTVDDAAREEIARAADTHVLRLAPDTAAPTQAAPAKAETALAVAEPVVTAPKAAAPVASPAKAAVSDARLAKSGIDRFPVPAFSAKAEKLLAAPRLAKAAPAPAPRLIDAPKPKRTMVPTLAAATPKKPVTLSAIPAPQGRSVVKQAHVNQHSSSFAATFATMPAPVVNTSVAAGTAGFNPAPDALAVSTQFGLAQSAPVIESAPSAPEIIAQPTTPSASVAELPATTDGGKS